METEGILGSFIALGKFLKNKNDDNDKNNDTKDNENDKTDDTLFLGRIRGSSWKQFQSRHWIGWHKFQRESLLYVFSIILTFAVKFWNISCIFIRCMLPSVFHHLQWRLLDASGILRIGRYQYY